MAGTEEVLPTVWTTLWSEENVTGTWRTATPVYQERPSPCYGACPVNGAIPNWIESLRKGNMKEAWSKILCNNPFPSVTGRVCHHPCEEFCNRASHDEKISIKSLERFVGDFGLKHGWSLPQKKDSLKQRVAIIGGGPAGLAAAYHLHLKGYEVEIFEAQKQLGGLLRCGIPPYRLPRNVLEQEIERFLQTGILIHYGSYIKGFEDFLKLKKEYDALFISTGAPKPKKLTLLDYDSSVVLDGLHFLFQFNSQTIPSIGKRVAVIGGGNTAVDAARVARRLGAEQVTVVYRRTEEQLPCQKIEVLEAREEGVDFQFLVSPLKLETEKGQVKLVCQKMKLGEEDASGRPRPEAVKNAYVTLEVDNVLVAIGSDPVLPELENQFTATNSLMKVNKNKSTDVDGVFAGGDLTSTERYVSSALGDGKKAAEGMAQFLGAPATAGNFDGENVTYEEINTFYFPKKTGVKNNTLDVAERIKGFEEVQHSILEDQAFQESERCFICGKCIVCDNCFYYCPDMAIKKNGTGLNNYTLLDQYCKGCGLCVKECPRGAIVLREEIR